MLGIDKNSSVELAFAQLQAPSQTVGKVLGHPLETPKFGVPDAERQRVKHTIRSFVPSKLFCKRLACNTEELKLNSLSVHESSLWYQSGILHTKRKHTRPYLENGPLKISVSNLRPSRTITVLKRSHQFLLRSLARLQARTNVLLKLLGTNYWHSTGGRPTCRANRSLHVFPKSIGKLARTRRH